jgi:hypothetical protein
LFCEEVSALAEEQEVERLFGLSPEAFVAARTEAARRLKREGDAEAAARVAALRRPPLSAWAVNQLARGHGPEVERLLEAGARLRAAHQAALAGGGAAELRASTRAEREAAAGLVDAAVEILRSAGHPATDATRDRIAATLHAAAGDPAAAELVRSGRLTHDLDPVGFGTVDALAAAAGGTPTDPDGNGRPAPRRPRSTTSRRTAAATGAEGAKGAGGRSAAVDTGAEGAEGAAAGSADAEGAAPPGGGTEGAAARGEAAAGGRRGGAAAARGGGAAGRRGGRAAASPEEVAAARARRVAAVAARDEARRRARLAADQAVLATRHAERLGRLADQAEREAERARATATAAIEAAAAARERASRAARELADAEDQLADDR